MTHPFSHRGLESEVLPIVTGSSLTDCSGCGLPVGGNTYVTDWDGDPLCYSCVDSEPALWPWRRLAEAYNAADAAFKDLRTRDQRQAFANLLVDHVGHVASWRWPDDEPIAPAPLH